MNEKILFESKGGNKTVEIIQFFIGGFLTVVGLFLLISVASDKGGMSHSGYGGTWTYREAPGTEAWILVIVILVLGITCFISGIASKQAYLKIYENHIEAKSFDFTRLLIGGKGSVQSNIELKYGEIQGVSVQRGMIVLDTYGKTKSVFCSDCRTAEKILLECLKTNKKSSN